MTGNTWFKIRLALIAIGFAAGMFLPWNETATAFGEMPREMLVLVLILSVGGVLLSPIILLFVIGIQSTNPFSDRRWTRPAHRSNPFRFGNPLLFFHFAAYFTGAQALGVLVSALWWGPYAAAMGALGIAGAAGILLGVRLSMRVFKRKMEDAPPAG